MYRPSFIVVTATITVLALVGIFVRLASKYLPLPEINALRYESAEYLRQASQQEIDWRPFDPTDFAAAREQRKPVMLALGEACNAAARTADRMLFSDPDVAQLLNRRMICVRVDLWQRREWMSAFLPITRESVGMQSGFQLLFLKPSGELFDLIVLAPWDAPDPAMFFRRLAGIVDQYEALRLSGEQSAAGKQQARESELISGKVDASQPQFELQDAALSRALNREFGGFPTFRRIEFRASALRYLLLRGNYEEFRVAIDPLLRTPIVDWLDGGFFAAVSQSEFPQVEFDKIATQNAETMHALAMAGVLMRDKTYESLAKRAFDALAANFLRGGLIAAGRVGDEIGRGRSARSSFSPQELRESLIPEDREWLRDRMKMRVEENPAMAMAARDPAAVLAEGAKLHDISQKLLVSKKDPRYEGFSYLDVNGFVIARLIETARIWGDQKRSSVAAELFERLDLFRAGDDVRHSLQRQEPLPPYLGDYLAYADAALQHFLATGNAPSLARGARVLERARSLFETGAPGVWNVWLSPPSSPGPEIENGPELLDFERESLTAQAIRLLSAYGRLLRSTRKLPYDGLWQRADSFRNASNSAISKFGRLSGDIALFGSGYFCAALSTLDNSHAVTVGPAAQELADALFRLVPTRLITGAYGDVRPDLQERSPGIYVVSGDSVRGPLNVEQAARLLLTKLSPPTP